VSPLSPPNPLSRPPSMLGAGGGAVIAIEAPHSGVRGAMGAGDVRVPGARVSADTRAVVMVVVPAAAMMLQHETMDQSQCLAFCIQIPNP
jgi:hypothetical protein